MIANMPLDVQNMVIRRDVKTPTVKEEIAATLLNTVLTSAHIKR
jgi:hypothetical protein